MNEDLFITDEMHCNTKTLTKIFGVSENVITDWIRKGLPVHHQSKKQGYPNRFYLPDCIEWVTQHLVSKAVGNRLDLQQETARKNQVQRKILELDLDTKRQSLIETDTVSQHLNDIIDIIRTRMTDIPTRTVEHFESITTAEELRMTLDQQIRDALEETSRVTEE